MDNKKDLSSILMPLTMIGIMGVVSSNKKIQLPSRGLVIVSSIAIMVDSLIIIKNNINK
jgi:hypothetical protein